MSKNLKENLTPDDSTGKRPRKKKCACPTHCKFCGARRRRDYDGTHWCATRNCQWQHGYSTCRSHA
jgi:hypothetical protein